MASKRRAWRARIWTGNTADSVRPTDLWVGSRPAAYRQARDRAEYAEIMETPVKMVQVMVRAAGSEQWHVEETIWRHQPPPRTWRMHAYQEDGYFENFGEREWVRLHGMDLPIVEVVLTEDPQGHYYGWLATGEDEPTMIWPSRAQFECCFPYSWRDEVLRGHGEALRMRAELAEEGT
jgi:hypothetical protein